MKESEFDPKSSVLLHTIQSAGIRGALRAHQVGPRMQTWLSPALPRGGGGEVATGAGTGSGEHLPGLWSGKRPAGPGLGLLPPGGPAWGKGRRWRQLAVCPSLSSFPRHGHRPGDSW